MGQAQLLLPTTYSYDALGSLYSRTTRPVASYSFTDDFSAPGDLGNWTYPTGAPLSIASDSGISALSASALSGGGDIWKSASLSGDFSFSAKVKITQTGQSYGGAGLIFRSANTTTSQDQNEYYFDITPAGTDASGNPAPLWTLYKVSGGNWSALGSGPLKAGTASWASSYHVLGVTATGDTYQLLIDGDEVGSFTDATLTGGVVGLSSYFTNAFFTDVRLDGPASGAVTYLRYNEASGALAEETDAGGTVTVSYVTTPAGAPVSVTRTVNGTKGTFYYHMNAHGDVTAITDQSGNVVATYTYDPFGVPTEFGPSGAQEPIGQWAGSPNDGLFFLFGSMLFDAATGLYLTKSRVYDPKTGRFLSRDTVMQKGKNDSYEGFPFGADAIGTNLYAWCSNNPVNRMDPSGHAWYNWVYDHTVGYGVSGAEATYNWGKNLFWSGIHWAERTPIGRAVSAGYNWLFGGGLKTAIRSAASAVVGWARSYGSRAVSYAESAAAASAAAAAAAAYARVQAKSAQEKIDFDTELRAKSNRSQQEMASFEKQYQGCANTGIDVVSAGKAPVAGLAAHQTFDSSLRNAGKESNETYIKNTFLNLASLGPGIGAGESVLDGANCIQDIRGQPEIDPFSFDNLRNLNVDPVILINP